MYEFGKIVLIPFPFTDLSSAKLRPALILSKTQKSKENVIVSFITSSIPSKIPPNCYLLKRNNKIFKDTGLKTDSLIRFDKIATLSKKIILGELGKIQKENLKTLKKTFLSNFGF